MGKTWKGSVTVEAALLYPYLFLITFLAVRLTLLRYDGVREQAAGLYDAVFTDRKLWSSELVRASDAAFDLFGK